MKSQRDNCSANNITELAGNAFNKACVFMAVTMCFASAGRKVLLEGPEVDTEHETDESSRTW